MQPILTFGGISGKNNKIPKTGNKNSKSEITRTVSKKSTISIVTRPDTLWENISFNADSREIKINVPIPNARFIPRYAYKALSKMAISIMPEAELPNYKKLIEWLRDENDKEDFQCLETTISYSNILHPLRHVYGVLLKRSESSADTPYMIFILVVGSICFQIDLLSDHMEDNLPPRLMGTIKIKWGIQLSDGNGSKPIHFHYVGHHHENWSSIEKTERRLKEFDINIAI